MARILFAWELGSGFGHLDRMRGVARKLQALGHTPVFALRDLSRADLRLPASLGTVMQAPIWLPQLSQAPRIGNYALILAGAGWLDPVGLTGLVRGWQALFDTTQAELVVVDHAPTALLAAKLAGLPAWGVGNSFELPPLGPHFPPMAFWQAGLDAHCAAWDQTVLGPLNQGLQRLGAAPWARLGQLFEGVPRLILGLSELSHYGPLVPAHELAGPNYVDDVGQPANWPAGTGPQVFVYLNPASPVFLPLMQQLKALGWPTLAFARGLAPDTAAALASPHLHLATQPLHMGQVLASAPVVVSHASLGTVTAAALAACPQLVVPNHMEQRMTAHRLLASGSGLLLAPDQPPAQWRAQLQALAPPQSAARQAARALADRHAGAHPDQATQRVALAICQSLAAAAGRPAAAVP